MKNKKKLSLYVHKESLSMGAFPFLNSDFFVPVLFYKIDKFDLLGGIDAELWDIVFSATKVILQDGVEAYLSSKGFCTKFTSKYFAFELFYDYCELHSNNLLCEVKRINNSNPIEPADVKRLAFDCIECVENQLIPSGALDVFGSNDEIDWKKREDFMLEMRKMLEATGWNNISDKYNPFSADNWNYKQDLTSRVFGNLE